jgi:DNA-binding beta-propeller fold protein YncE
LGSEFSLGQGPAGVAINPLTNTVYVTNANDNTVSIITKISFAEICENGRDDDGDELVDFLDQDCPT